MRNPYIVGSPVRPPHLYGRHQILDELMDQRHRCIYLVGNRRSGKTSLLNYVEIMSGDPVLFLNLQRTENSLSSIANQLLRQIHRQRQFSGFFADISTENNTSIVNVVDMLDDAANRSGQKVLLLFDEAEKLLEIDSESLEHFRSAIQDSASVHTIITATKALGELNDRWRREKRTTSPFLFGFSTHYVPLLTDFDAESLIRQDSNREGNVQVADALVDEIMERTGNNPYLIQLLCYRLFLPREERLRPIESPERDLVVDDALSALFQIDFDNLSFSERKLLLRIASDTAINGHFAVSDLPDTDSFRYLESLERLGYLRYKQQVYSIGNDFLLTWLNSQQFQTENVRVSDLATREVIGAAVDR